MKLLNLIAAVLAAPFVFVFAILVACVFSAFATVVAAVLLAFLIAVGFVSTLIAAAQVVRGIAEGH